MENARHLTDLHAQPPADAYRFLAPAELPAAPQGQARTLKGVAYSGGVIEPHHYWGRVVFDLASVEIPPAVPVLVDHDRSRRVGVAQMAVEGNALTITGGRLLTNEDARQVADDADAGFPFQLSVHIEPSNVQRVEPGETVTINGAQHFGPIHVFRDSRIREVSLTPTGADHRTSAQVFSAPPTGAVPMQQPQTTTPTAEQFAALEAKLQEAEARNAELQQQLAQFSASQREADVRALFSDLGRQFSAEAAAPYLSLDATAFSALAADLRANHKPAQSRQLPAHLFAEQATSGVSGEAIDPHALALQARQFMAKAAAEGRTVSTAEAVAAVRAGAAS